MRVVLLVAFVVVMFSLVIAGWAVRWWARRLAAAGEDPSERKPVRLFALLARDPYFGREYAKPKKPTPTQGGE